MTVAVAVNDQGRREVLGVAIGASEAETFWTEFLRSLARRGLRGVKLVISDDHKGLKAAATRILGATWQRCRVHFARNLLAHAGRQGRRVVSAFVATAFAQEDADSAKVQWRQVADQLRPKVPKLAVLMDEAEHDVLAYMSFPREHHCQSALKFDPLSACNIDPPEWHGGGCPGSQQGGPARLRVALCATRSEAAWGVPVGPPGQPGRVDGRRRIRIGS